MQTDINDVAIQKAIQILTNMGCQFRIITADGKEFGEIKKRKKRVLLQPHGTLVKYFKEYLGNLQPGQKTIVPKNNNISIRLQSAICSWATTNWGKETYATTIIGNEIHVLRYL